MNPIFESSPYGELIVKIGLPPGNPGKPIDVTSSFTDETIDIVWPRPESEGGWPITTFEIWIDDGSGNWPILPISLDATEMDLDNLSYQMEGLNGGATYGVKITATNAIGTSLESVTQYFVCANLPNPPDAAPIMETATEKSITIAWNPPANDGGSPIIGYRVYMNYLNDGDWELVFDGY